MSGFQLVRLQCPTCGSGIVAEGEDVVYYCVSCRSATVSPAKRRRDSPRSRSASWRRPRSRPAAGCRSGSCRRRSLCTSAKARAAASRVCSVSSESAAATSPARPREGAFAVPAFAAPLAEVTALATRYTQELPQLLARGGERLGERLTGGRLAPADAEKLAHYVLVAAEAAKPDTLRTLRYTLDFGPARLLGVPFVQSGGRWTDGYFNLPATLGDA